jgi:hypothetical protein
MNSIANKSNIEGCNWICFGKNNNKKNKDQIWYKIKFDSPILFFEC